MLIHVYLLMCLVHDRQLTKCITGLQYLPGSGLCCISLRFHGLQLSIFLTAGARSWLAINHVLK